MASELILEWGRRDKAQRAESGDGVLGEATASPSPPTKGNCRLRERCKLPQRGLGRGRGATGSRGSIDLHFFRCGVHIWCLTPHFLSGFSLSRPVNPKHNPCTLSDDAQMLSCNG